MTYLHSNSEMNQLFFGKIVFVSPAKQKRDICIIFPASSSSAAKTFCV